MASKSEKGASSTAITLQQQENERLYCGFLDLAWPVGTFEGILKVFQFFTTLLTFAILCTAFKTDPYLKNYKMNPEYEFMVFVAVTAWIFVSLHILLKMTHLYEQLPAACIRPEAGLVLVSVGVFIFLVASSLVASYSYIWSALKASAAFGFVSAFLFLVEVVYMVVRFRKSREYGNTTEEVIRFAADNTKTVAAAV
ncbi:predicted protein [Nematostella vectensis]|uniref:MARVEL domain-containing protein n=1 Tax=Nematostella vectensis TaxID=45351 RepID=A7SKT6_NEMVE|nr:CKLF-like MARVEL transmembrane domain-containing protein 6 [Nematostella vectensis]EDO35695.1 predicted protein [Nematostella vectensis]|eukprot:XP_001627795.1 predicted protein [Nematostella vectensis]